MGLQRYAYSYVSKFWRCRVLSIWKGVTRGIRDNNVDSVFKKRRLGVVDNVDIAT